MIPHMDDYSVVHLATHAKFVAGSPDGSFILFGNGDRPFTVSLLLLLTGVATSQYLHISLKLRDTLG